jgi:hypothetical protein
MQTMMAARTSRHFGFCFLVFFAMIFLRVPEIRPSQKGELFNEIIGLYGAHNIPLATLLHFIKRFVLLMPTSQAVNRPLNDLVGYEVKLKHS